MGKQVLAFDADGVTTDYYRPYLDRLNEACGTKHTYEQCTNHNFALALGINENEIKSILKTHADHKFWCSLPPVAGAVETLALLAERYDLVIITSRPDECREATHEWFNQHAPQVQVNFAIGRNNPYGGKVGRIHKPQLAEQIGAIALVEDNTDEILHWDSSHVEPVCFAQPWNASLSITHPHIHRLDWIGILAKFAPELVEHRSASR